MKRTGVVLVAVGLAAICMFAAHAEDNPLGTARTAMEEALAKGDVQSARAEAHHLLDAAQGLSADKLTPEDQYALGLAHTQIAAEALEQALQSGKLTKAQAAAAKALLAKLAPPQPPLIVVGHGERVNLDDVLVAGKTTVVDFYSKYCGPCMALAPHLEELVKQRDDVAVVKVDINRPGHEGIDWASPVARQFQLDSIPHLRLYGPDKQLQLEGEAAMTKVLGWCGLQ